LTFGDAPPQSCIPTPPDPGRNPRSTMPSIAALRERSDELFVELLQARHAYREVDPLHRLGTFPRPARRTDLLLRRPRRRPTSPAWDTLAHLLALVPLCLRDRHGARDRLDHRHPFRRMAAPLAAYRRVGLRMGLRRLLAGERRRARHTVWSTTNTHRRGVRLKLMDGTPQVTES